jgi:NNP family nitrate/nitrite transporter-like MFS transporter
LAGIGLGQTTSIATGPMFTELKPAFLVAIILAVVVLAIWVALLKNPPNLPKMEPMPMSQSLKFVIGKRDVWVGGLGIFFLLGTYVVATSFSAQFLVADKSVEPKTASLIASAIAFLMLVGGLASDRTARMIGSSRIFLFLTGVAAAAGSLLALWLPYGIVTVLSLCLLGFAAGLFCSYILALPMLLSYIGPVYAGSAGGLISTLMSAGGFSLPYIFPMLAGGDLKKLMVWVAVGFILMGTITLALPELVKKTTSLAKAA